MSNPVNHPPHYNAGAIEVIDVIEDWNLGFCLGNTVKYIAHSEHKGTRLQDLQKAQWYLQREITRLLSTPSTKSTSSTKPTRSKK